MKKSPYQKLKEERDELRDKLIEVVTNPDSIKSMEIKMEVQHQVDLSRVLWFGDPNSGVQTKIIDAYIIQAV